MLLLLVVSAVACGVGGSTSDPLGVGSDPQLPAPDESLLPTVNIAPAVGWPDDAAPIAVDGLAVNSFAVELQHPRWLYLLPNGDVLVAETNAPARPGDAQGLRGWLAKRLMKRAGAAVPSANRITLLRDIDGDGRAETRSLFLQGLNSPFGMALVGNDLYVANTDALLRFAYATGDTEINSPGAKVADLPAGPINHHWTKNVFASPDGTRLFVTVGSNSNVAENGLDQEINRAAILEVEADTGISRVFASGLRNPNGLAWNVDSGELWTTVNERDELGDNLVPDYMTSVQRGAFYGWPYSYFGQNVDARVEPQRPDLVASALQPDYALGSHTASLGLVFYYHRLLPEQYHRGAFIAQHGSWNRRKLSGYKVVFVPFENGQPHGRPQDVLTGFLNEDGEAQGRPVGVIVDSRGALLVADDVGNTVWRVTPVAGRD
jgi:glucose/arabinose dehydrogenase